MPNRAITGAVALLAAPIIVIVATLAPANPVQRHSQPGRRARRAPRGDRTPASALSSISSRPAHHQASSPFALALAPRAPRLAIAGGVLGVLGLLAVLFENSVAATFPAIASGLDRIQRRRAGPHPFRRHHDASGHCGSSAISASPYSASPPSRRGRPGWAGAAIAVGALAQAPGFATGAKALVIMAFAVLFLACCKPCARLPRAPRAPAGWRGCQGRSRLLRRAGVPGCFALSSGDGRQGNGYRTLDPPEPEISAAEDRRPSDVPGPHSQQQVLEGGPPPSQGSRAGSPLRGSGNLNSAGLGVCNGDLCLFPGGVLSSSLLNTASGLEQQRNGQWR